MWKNDSIRFVDFLRYCWFGVSILSEVRNFSNGPVYAWFYQRRRLNTLNEHFGHSSHTAGWRSARRVKQESLENGNERKSLLCQPGRYLGKPCRERRRLRAQTRVRKEHHRAYSITKRPRERERESQGFPARTERQSTGQPLIGVRGAGARELLEAYFLATTRGERPFTST